MKTNREIGSIRRLLLPLGFVLLQGCSLPGWSAVDRDLRDLGAEANLPGSARTVDTLPSGLPASRTPPVLPPRATVSASPIVTTSPSPPAVQPIVFHQPPKGEEKPEKRPPDRIAVPPELPGADAPALPKMDVPPAEREKRVAAFFPPTPPLPPEPLPAPGPEGHPVTLADLQRLGETYSPAIKNAKAAVAAARGAAIQSGMYPNPIFSFENDTIQTGPAGYPGFQIEQTIKTGGKLKLQQASALMDVLNAKAALRRARTDLMTAIRGTYFAVLVARENARVSDALFRFCESIYRYQVATVQRGGFAAAYEPLQLRPLVLQARLQVLQARNQYHASWRQLAASLGLPHMPPSELAGRVDMAIPMFDYEQVQAHLFKNHTDVITAENNIRKAKYGLELAKIVPLPDVYTRLLVQKDYSTPPNQVAASVQFGVPVPLWDQNKGGIRQAAAQLAQALVGPDQARNALVNTLADAYNRYETGRLQVEVTSQQVRDQLRAYRGLRARRESDPNSVGFGDLVTAQQTLAGYIAGYTTALGFQWQAVVDVANVSQTDDLFTTAQSQEMLLVPDLGDLELGTPHHSCAPTGASGEVRSLEKMDNTVLATRWVDPNPRQLPASSGLTGPAVPEIIPASGPPR